MREPFASAPSGGEASGECARFSSTPGGARSPNVPAWNQNGTRSRVSRSRGLRGQANKRRRPEEQDPVEAKPSQPAVASAVPSS
jgi:hypothetical protein